MNASNGIAQIGEIWFFKIAGETTGHIFPNHTEKTTLRKLPAVHEVGTEEIEVLFYVVGKVEAGLHQVAIFI